MMKIFYALLTVLLLVGLWQVAEDASSARRIAAGETTLEAFIPSPRSMGVALAQDGDLILHELLITLGRAGAGFVLGTLAALLFAVGLWLWPSLRNIVLPLAFGINSFPIVGLAPVVILAFGQGSWWGIVFVAGLISYFPTLIALDAAFHNVRQDLLDVFTTFKASKWQLLTKLYLPSSLPYWLIALKIAVPSSLIGATVGEWLGVREGIGQLVTIGLYQLKPGLLYASLLSIAAVGLIVVGLISWAENRWFKWAREVS